MKMIFEGDCYINEQDPYEPRDVMIKRLGKENFESFSSLLEDFFDLQIECSPPLPETKLRITVEKL